MASKPSKIENKTQPSLCLQTWLQQNLRISTNHKYRIYGRFVGIPRSSSLVLLLSPLRGFRPRDGPPPPEDSFPAGVFN
jgi:hypothetical protein